ncbi:hypothetical protein KY290_000881 [Solanum tuberosum]|uniref:Uncharacterized protein n=1 Tax=Solanum tuberosum TaxID=4113 RepID=A0ABQ7WKL3_SOLTU|nr:hypothetical protein KY290_000881 [Solanum tuberosum]
MFPVMIKMIKEAPTQGICYIFKKSLISSLKLKDVWKHVKWHNNKANEKSQHDKANQVYVMDNTSCPTKMQDRKGKSIVNCSETYQDQEKYRSQKQQAPNVEPITSTNFNEEHHSNVLNSSNFSADVNELFQGAYIPQPLEVPLVALPSSNDYSLNECDEWINEFLELDDLS